MTTLEATNAIATLLAGHRYAYTAERELQTTIAHVLRNDGYTVRQEASLTAADRIDFLVARWPNLAAKMRLDYREARESVRCSAASSPVIGIETKVKGAVMDVRRQVLRYLESDRLDGLVLVSNKFTHAAAVKGLPSEKPVVFCCIARAA